MSGFIFKNGQRTFTEKEELFCSMVSELIEAGIELHFKKFEDENLVAYMVTAPSIDFKMEIESPSRIFNSTSNGLIKAWHGSRYCWVDDGVKNLSDLARRLGGFSV